MKTVEAPITPELFLSQVAGYGGEQVAWVNTQRRQNGGSTYASLHTFNRHLYIGLLPDEPIVQQSPGGKRLPVLRAGTLVLSTVYTGQLYAGRDVTSSQSLMDLDERAHCWLLSSMDRPPKYDEQYINFPEGRRMTLHTMHSTPLALGNAAVETYIENQSHIMNQRALEFLTSGLLDQ